MKYNWSGARGQKWRAHMERMEAMLAPVDSPLIDALRLDEAYQVADIGCGGGGTSLEILRRGPKGTSVHGFDLSSDLIEAARARIAEKETGVRFEVADAGTASSEVRFQRLCSRFGVMFFADPSSAFSNLSRWLESGGRSAFAAWGPVADNPWFRCVREVVAQVVELPSAKADAPGPFRYAEVEPFLALLRRSGWSKLNAQAWRGQLPIGGGLSAKDAAQFALTAFALFHELLSEAGPRAFEQAHRSLSERFEEHTEDGVVRMEACVHIIEGERDSRSIV